MNSSRRMTTRHLGRDRRTDPAAATRPPAEKQQALAKLIKAGAEPELTSCLAAQDPITAKLATSGYGNAG